MLLFQIFFLQFTQIWCIIVFNKFNGHFNKPLINVSINVYSDGVHDSTLDFWWEQFVAIEKLFIYIRLNVPADNNDEEFTKEMFRVMVDGVKLFKNGYNNFLVKMIVESILAHIDWEPKFPLVKGVYRIKNMTFSDQYAPPFMPKHFLVGLRLVAKVTGQKQQVFISQYAIYSEIRR